MHHDIHMMNERQMNPWWRRKTWEGFIGFHKLKTGFKKQSNNTDAKNLRLDKRVRRNKKNKRSKIDNVKETFLKMLSIPKRENESLGVFLLHKALIQGFLTMRAN